jgi:hypothetical protein
VWLRSDWMRIVATKKAFDAIAQTRMTSYPTAATARPARRTPSGIGGDHPKRTSRLAVTYSASIASPMATSSAVSHVLRSACGRARSASISGLTGRMSTTVAADQTT